VKAIILGAGQGRRLLPLTADIPKALLDVGGQPLVHRQIDAVAGAGIRDVVVITGYGASAMERELKACSVASKIAIRTVYNPFFAVADNLASCWMARNEMDGDFLQINGDNVFRSELISELLASAGTQVTVAVNRKSRYDADDMKVMLDGTRLTEIGKTLPAEAVDAEAIGIYAFRGDGVRCYRKALETVMGEANGLKQWFPTAVGRVAKEIDVTIWDVGSHEWCEIDFPIDLQSARQMVARWG
jgi:choline kinase